MSEPLEPLAIRPFAGDDDLERAVARRRLDQEVDPLRAVEAVDREDEVAVVLAAVLERLRRMWEHLGVEAGRRLDTVGDVLRDREEPGRLAERDAVERLHLPAGRPLLGRVAELPEVGSVELVRLAELVDEPDALLGVANEVRGELRADHEVDPLPVRLLEVEHPPEERLREDACTRVPLERDGDDVGVMPSTPELVDEPVREDLGAAVRERHLRAADGDSHCVLRVASSSAWRRSTCSCRSSIRPERSGVERPLVVGERFDVPAHELAKNGLDGCPQAAADSGTKAQRAICGDRPQPLGLRPCDAPLLLVAATRPRIGAGSADLLAERPEEFLDVDGSARGNPCRIAIFGVIRGHRGILSGA